jgi:hypothetical protein
MTEVNNSATERRSEGIAIVPREVSQRDQIVPGAAGAGQATDEELSWARRHVPKDVADEPAKPFVPENLSREPVKQIKALNPTQQPAEKLVSKNPFRETGRQIKADPDADAIESRAGICKGGIPEDRAAHFPAAGRR